MLLLVPRAPVAVCRCGHAHAAHAHYRAGTECALCSCVRFRRDWWGEVRARRRPPDPGAPRRR